MDLLLIILLALALLAAGWALFFGLFLAAVWLFLLGFCGLASIWVRRAGRQPKPAVAALRLFAARKP